MGSDSRIGQLMRSDWDRRVSHDYRFWMSDGHASDDAMWKAGERDFGILTAGIDFSGTETVLEVGCGVGRLLKAALPLAGQVIGLDISAKAIEKAKQLLGTPGNLTLHVGNGFDLQPVSDGSVDVVLSFAALSSMPTSVVAQYLSEMNRILKMNGRARLQMYVGTEQFVRADDTLNIRCYAETNLQKAFVAAGFSVASIKELQLPFQVSFKEMGIGAVIIDLSKVSNVQASPTNISEILLPDGERKDSDTTIGLDLEYWMTLNYAKELVEYGDIEKAKEALEYAETVQKTTTIDVGDLLQRIVSKIDSVEQKNNKSIAPVANQMQSSDMYQTNCALIRDRFPQIYSKLITIQEDNSSSVEISSTLDGPIFTQNGICLDHNTKPRAAAETWVKRAYQDNRVIKADTLVIIGLSAAYHIRALHEHATSIGQKVSMVVIEPNAVLFKRLLEIRDANEWLPYVSHLEIGKDCSFPKVTGELELLIRPQTQAVEPDFCAKMRSEYYGVRGLSLLHPSIGVLGPMQGGGVPMLPYLTRGLGVIEQRYREFDVSGFSSGYGHLEKFVRDKYRRTSIENTYCEMVSQVILESVNEKPIDILVSLALAPISPRVLMELKKRGIITVQWFFEDYARFGYWRETAKYYDFVFTIQKGKCIDAIRAAGAGEVHYLPVGCDPGLHAPQILTEEERKRWGSPISFMGAGYHNRQQLFASFADMPLKIWGTEWPTCRPFDRLVQEEGRRLTPGEYLKIFSATDININLHSSHERDGVDPFGDFLNPRTFELASAGAFQLVDKRSLLADCFEDGKEIVTFDSGPDLKQKIAYYLAHPEERARIALAGRQRALRDHTYAQRMQQMLSIIYSSRYEQLRSRDDASPWRKLKSRAAKHPELNERCNKAFARGEEPTLDALISDVVTGQGKLTETEQKLLFLYHIRRQIIRMREEEKGGQK